MRHLSPGTFAAPRGLPSFGFRHLIRLQLGSTWDASCLLNLLYIYFPLMSFILCTFFILFPCKTVAYNPKPLQAQGWLGASWLEMSWRRKLYFLDRPCILSYQRGPKQGQKQSKTVARDQTCRLISTMWMHVNAISLKPWISIQSRSKLRSCRTGLASPAFFCFSRPRNCRQRTKDS